MRELSEFIEVGQIINTHGVVGEVKVDPWCDNIKVFKNLTSVFLKDGKEYKITSTKFLKDRFSILKLEGIDSVESAILLKGKTILAARKEIKKDNKSFFVCDLIGLSIFDVDTNVEYGTLMDVIQNTCQDIYQVKLLSGEVCYIPVVKEFVKKIDIETGIYIKPIEGLLGGAEEL